MNLEEQIRRHKEISHKIEELETEKKELSQSIMQAMTSRSLQMGTYLVKRYSRLSVTTPLEQARYYHAIKLEEVIDKDKLKAMHKNGQPIPGVKETEYIIVTQTSEAFISPQIHMNA